MSSQLPWYLRFQKLPLVILASLIVSVIIAGLRQAGLFEVAELWAYDRLIQLRSQSTPDDRIVVVGVDDATLKKLNSDKVSDQALTQALQNLEKHQPRVIGVDILRDVPIGSGRQAFLDYTNQVYNPLPRQIKPIIFTCQLPSVEEPEGIDPPPVLDPDSSIGFANIEVDTDGVIRRVPISSIPVPNVPEKGKDAKIIDNKNQSKCLPPFSLGFLISLSYLQKENIYLDTKLMEDGILKVGDVVFQPPTQKAGGYRNLDPGLYQIILDYRLKQPIETISFANVLDGAVNPEQIKDKIVLIGYTTKDDVHSTPYGMQPGVFIHVQAINQILSNLLDKRTQFWDFPEPVVWLWLMGWGVAGGIIAWKCRPTWVLYVSEGGALVVLCGTAFFLFTQQGWIPLVPSVLTLLLSAVVVRSLPQLKPSPKRTTPKNLTPPIEDMGETVISDSNYRNHGTQQTMVESALPTRQQRQTTDEWQQTTDEWQQPTVTLPPETYVERVQNHLKPLTPQEPSNPSSPSNPRREFVRTNPYSAYIGQRLGEGDRYRIDTHIGGGGMGQVYLASDTKLKDLPVAIKVMTSYSGSDNENLIRRFQREVEFMASFRSMNIVKISDFGLTSQESPFQGSPFYVMEYLQGTTLTKRLEQVGRLSVERAIPIIRQICAGLREAHQLGIAHRDLKPDNIYLIPNEALGEIVKILDFGIAKIVDKGATDQTSHTLTAMGAFVGTYRYASPEQCLGDSAIDHRTDIYSLGVLIYEMLSGTNPYNVKVGQNTQGYWISSHISKKAHPLRSQPGCETLSPELEAVVMKCLEKSSDDRFASINELEIALRTIL